jgi:hypothetical protein
MDRVGRYMDIPMKLHIRLRATDDVPLKDPTAIVNLSIALSISTSLILTFLMPFTSELVHVHSHKCPLHSSLLRPLISLWHYLSTLVLL